AALAGAIGGSKGGRGEKLSRLMPEHLPAARRSIKPAPVASGIWQRTLGDQEVSRPDRDKFENKYWSELDKIESRKLAIIIRLVSRSIISNIT
ncbi:MAG: hypothetical protein NTY41_19220, partial [Proteobacteria bacterium]|nr:hypothetical protein [Pseudomonadota bacterium]